MWDVNIDEVSKSSTQCGAIVRILLLNGWKVGDTTRHMVVTGSSVHIHQKEKKK